MADYSDSDNSSSDTTTVVLSENLANDSQNNRYNTELLIQKYKLKRELVKYRTERLKTRTWVVRDKITENIVTRIINAIFWIILITVIASYEKSHFMINELLDTFVVKPLQFIIENVNQIIRDYEKLIVVDF